MKILLQIFLIFTKNSNFCNLVNKIIEKYGFIHVWVSLDFSFFIPLFFIPSLSFPDAKFRNNFKRESRKKIVQKMKKFT